MTPGTVIARGDRLFAVLAAQGDRIAVAPIAFRRLRRAHDVPVQVGGLGPATAICSAATVEGGAWSETGIVLAAAELVACQTAAERAKRESALDRFAPLALFAAAQPHFRSGGRRVGGVAAGA